MKEILIGLALAISSGVASAQRANNSYDVDVDFYGADGNYCVDTAITSGPNNYQYDLNVTPNQEVTQIVIRIPSYERPRQIDFYLSSILSSVEVTIEGLDTANAPAFKDTLIMSGGGKLVIQSLKCNGIYDRLQASAIASAQVYGDVGRINLIDGPVINYITNMHIYGDVDNEISVADGWIESLTIDGVVGSPGNLVPINVQRDSSQWTYIDFLQADAFYANITCGEPADAAAGTGYIRSLIATGLTSGGSFNGSIYTHRLVADASHFPNTPDSVSIAGKFDGTMNITKWVNEPIYIGGELTETSRITIGETLRDPDYYTTHSLPIPPAISIDPADGLKGQIIVVGANSGL